MPPIPRNNYDPVNTPPNQSQRAAVIMAILPGGGTDRDVLGLTKGGGSFDPGIKKRSPDYDGKRHNVAGTNVITEYSSSISGTMSEFSPKTTGVLMAGSTVAGGVRTPMSAARAVQPGEMLKSVWYCVPLDDGRWWVVEFDYGEVMEWSVDTKDKDDATIRFRIDAAVDPTRPDYSSDLPDFRTFYVDADGNIITA